MIPFFLGNPRFSDPDLAHLQRESGDEAAWQAAFARHGVQAADRVKGEFAVAFCPSPGVFYLAVDRFARQTLCYRILGSHTALEASPRADHWIGTTPITIDPQALYDYFHFHVIPSPRTLYEGVKRLPASHYALLDNGKLTVEPYWKPHFQERLSPGFSIDKEEFLALLKVSVATQLDDSVPTGCYLSGGTDSSTLTGIATTLLGKGVPTYSIGFDAKDYDEMAFARIAARHFGTDHHEYYVTPDDLIAAIPNVAAQFDQPFGNSSALPGYYCARLAAQDGIQRMVAGDGGDELFGGNTRYAKQKVFHFYRHIPAALRQGLLEPSLPLQRSLPILKKLASYIEQARTPMPRRVTSHGLLESIGPATIFPAACLSLFDQEEPFALEHAVWHAQGEDTHFINQMLAYDWRFTLAENDLPKVRETSRLAHIHAVYPMLDERLVDFSLKLPADQKVNGFKLRWFFKEALRDLLPDTIISKKKHGFGLPFGIWLLQHAALRNFVQKSLQNLPERRLIRREFIEDLWQNKLASHPGYYGEMIWLLLMLEQWFQAKQPDFVLDV